MCLVSILRFTMALSDNKIGACALNNVEEKRRNIFRYQTENLQLYFNRFVLCVGFLSHDDFFNSYIYGDVTVTGEGQQILT